MPQSMKITVDTSNASKVGSDGLRHKDVEDKKPTQPKDKTNASR